MASSRSISRMRPSHKILHVAEGACLLPVPIQRQGLATQGLNDEIRYYTAIIRMHAWTIRIEDPHDLDVQPYFGGDNRT